MSFLKNSHTTKIAAENELAKIKSNGGSGNIVKNGKKYNVVYTLPGGNQWPEIIADANKSFNERHAKPSAFYK